MSPTQPRPIDSSLWLARLGDRNNSIRPIHAAGKAFQVYDRFHCSLMGPTWPNRYYMWSASSGGLIDNNPPVATGGNQWETLFDRALKSNPANAPGFGSRLLG